jgi:hypothetical protein
MFELSSDIYFVVYKLYYVDQNDDLGTRVWPLNRDGGSRVNSTFYIVVVYLWHILPYSVELLPKYLNYETLNMILP